MVKTVVDACSYHKHTFRIAATSVHCGRFNYSSLHGTVNHRLVVVAIIQGREGCSNSSTWVAPTNTLLVMVTTSNVTSA